MGKVAQVSLTPINGDLFNGVSTRTVVCEDKIRVKSYSPKNISIGISTETLEVFEDGYIFNLNSQLKAYSENYIPDTKVWRPFTVGGCHIKSLGSSYEIKNKIAFVNQKFKISGRPKGEFQFFCDNWNVKFRDQNFIREDILSFYYAKEIVQKFSIKTVKPDKLETFVPVSKGNKVHLIIDKSKGETDTIINESIFKREIDFGHSFLSLGYPMILECYSIKNNLMSTEVLNYKYRSYMNNIENRKIYFVPEKDKHFYIPEPFDYSKVITEDFYSFSIKMNKNLEVKISDNCPAFCSVVEVDKHFICLVEIKCPCPVILLEKNSTELLLKCP